MAEKKEYRNSVRSRRLIRQAFFDLLEEREFSRITVTDLVERADLNRSTFYAHYPDIYGVVEEIQQEIVERNMALFNRLEYRDLLRDPMPYLRSIAATLEEDRALLRKMGRTAPASRQLEPYRRIMVEDVIRCSDIPDEVRGSPALAVRVHFFIGGILNAFQEWADGTLDCTSDELCGEIAQVVRQSASDFLDRDWN